MARVLAHDAYTIAWICALPLEMAAAKLMLDAVHDNLPQPPTDHNCYTLGSIHGHNIAIACLPSGVYGTISATTVLAQMLPTFRSLKFGLMVGIGGGVPTKADVRLGDVVVGIPSGSSGGVIQFDFGKTLDSGRFQRVGSLNKPPQALLTAVSQLRSGQLLGEEEGEMMKSLSNAVRGRSDELTVDEAQGRSDAPRKQFLRPATDRLFDPSYTHQDLASDCSSCDPNMLLHRDPRDSDAPRVHYGSIASGNQVMKDARTRDSIAVELDILCFEMEAAGLMDQLPCLTIRGICDYCDSHKSKEWQGYAALTAAAYAKALLKVAPLYRNERQVGTRHWMVPFSRNAAFVGREGHIAGLEEAVLRSANMRKTAICGLGGIGKTQIALELAYRVRERDLDMSVFWVPCTSYGSVEQAYRNIAQATGVALIDGVAVTEQVKAFLSHESSGRWLLVYDNADDMQMWMKGTETGPPLKSLLPRNDAGRILFTTRNRKLAVKLAASNVVHLPDMDEDTALQMLHRLLIRMELLQDKESTAALLAQLCYLPLAISQAAAYINENDITALSDYLSLLDSQEQDLVSLLSEDFEDDARYADVQNPVTSTWLVSFYQVQSMNPLAVDYLCFMACISPRNIPQCLLPPAPSEKQRIEALAILKSYSFLSEEEETRSLTLHRLVHLATRAWMRRDGTFTACVLKTVEHVSQISAETSNVETHLWRQYLPHLLAVIDNNEFRAVRCQYVGLLQSMAQWLHLDKRPAEAMPLYLQALKGSEKTVGMGDKNPLDIMHGLGLVQLRLGLYSEAEQMLEQTLRGQNIVLGPEHEETLLTLQAYSILLLRQGRYARAKEITMQAVQGFERTVGPEHLYTLTSIGILSALLVVQGDWLEAEANSRRAMDGFVKTLGPQNETSLHWISNHGEVLLRQGRYAEAEDIHSKVLQTSEETLGPDNLPNVVCLSRLGTACVEQDRFEEAERILARAWDLAKRVLGPDHPDTLAVVDQLGVCVRNQGRLEEAKALHQHAIDSSITRLKQNHPLTHSFMASLADVHWEQGNFKQAEELEVKVWENLKHQLGVEHPGTMLSMHQLAFTWESMGERRKAIDLIAECVQLREKHLGPEHPATVLSRDTLAEWQQAENCSPATTLDCGSQATLQTEDDRTSIPVADGKRAIARAARWEISGTFRIPSQIEAKGRWKVWRRLRRKIVTP
ncbi:hypothetical protein BJY00DRAFT_112332 [Aspergillus carlsbadensis]|nr:hypothetical protein BJY00DRAFT_112332 [Aspergillus carlsbadensis]